jgi:hypothetical protein
LAVGEFPVLALHSFERVELPEANAERASVKEQEAFIISGARDDKLHYRDVIDGSQSYRAYRPAAKEIAEYLSAGKGKAVALILGGICSGKTIVFEETVMDILSRGEMVFRLNSKFYDFLDEARNIIHKFPSAIIAIDNCFSISRDLDEILERANASGSRLLLGSRTLAYDSEPDLRSRLMEETQFRVFDTEILNEDERDGVIHCADRIGVWGTRAATRTEKIRLVERTHHSRLSSFLLGIFNSAHVKDRFRSELDLVFGGGESVRHALIIALYLKSIGEPVNEHVLSALVQADSVSLFQGLKGSGAFVRFVPIVSHGVV